MQQASQTALQAASAANEGALTGLAGLLEQLVAQLEQGQMQVWISLCGQCQSTATRQIHDRLHDADCQPMKFDTCQLLTERRLHIGLVSLTTWGMTHQDRLLVDTHQLFKLTSENELSFCAAEMPSSQ